MNYVGNGDDEDKRLSAFRNRFLNFIITIIIIIMSTIIFPVGLRSVLLGGGEAKSNGFSSPKNRLLNFASEGNLPSQPSKMVMMLMLVLML